MYVCVCVCVCVCVFWGEDSRGSILQKYHADTVFFFQGHKVTGSLAVQQHGHKVTGSFKLSNIMTLALLQGRSHLQYLIACSM